MAYKEFRNMKVSEMSGYQYKRIPTIRLKGLWLRDLGFEEGVPIIVKCEGGKLTIIRADEVEGFYSESLDKAVTFVAEPKADYSKGETI